MAGAETQSNEGRELVPELRVTGIKGCMRFIWRAIQCADDVKKLRAAEGQLFGNAFGGKDNRQSDMRIRLMNMRFAAGMEVILPHRELDEYKSEPGYDRGRTKAFSARAIKSGSAFDVAISSFGEAERHRDFVRLFALTCLLYGFGRRSRKGFGTVMITGIDGVGGYRDVGGAVNYTFKGAEDNLNRLSIFGAEYSRPNDTMIRAIARSPADYPYIESIKIAGTLIFDHTEDIIGQIGMAAHHHAGEIFLGTLKPHFASSALLSTMPWDNDNYCCVVTQLHCTNPFTLAKRDEFYEELDGRV
jgi:CRISPR-associated protein Cmr1